MKAIHLSAYGNPAQSLRMVEVSEPNTPSASEALVRMEYAPIEYSDPPFSERSVLSETEASFCHWR
jgi:NADPH:quinone reductase-like Zn-dependent oxidoreductase